MPQQTNEPSLYGIAKENSNRFGSDLWGKNQFNSTFPLALCLYMRDKNHSPVGVVSRGDSIRAEEQVWGMSEVVASKVDDPYYHFEHVYDPYRSCSRNAVDKTDLVVSISGTPVIPLEVKLTVVPDNSTVGSSEENWGPEMVIRPVSSAYAMMGVAASLQRTENQSIKKQVIAELRGTFNMISDWSNKTEIIKY